MAATIFEPVKPQPVEVVGESSLDLRRTLQLVADTIVESLGFAIAVVNIVDDDAESMVVAAVSGSDEVRGALLGRRQGLAGWARLIEASEPWGRLRFLVSTAL